MAEVDDHGAKREPGMGAALLTVLGMILTIAVLSVLVWALMVGVTATTAGRGQGIGPIQPGPLIDQKAQPAKQP